MITYSAPGKVYLFGEHAVVYGMDAICFAINLRTFVTVTPNANINSVKIISSIGTTGIDFKIHPFVSHAIEKMRCLVEINGITLTIKSEIPIGSGLGSSAAVIVATISALNELYKLNLTKTEIAKYANEVEMKVQGRASPTDTYICTMGGLHFIKSKDVEALESIDVGIVIGNTNKFSSTKTQVECVKSLYEKYFDIINPIILNIGNLSEIGKQFIIKKDYQSLGTLMNINHGLLDAIGVGSLELSALIYKAREKGAYGAKITGAGGGGCMVAICDRSKTNKIKSALDEFGTAIITKPTKEGVRLE